MDQQEVKKPKGRILKWILGIVILLVLLMGGTYVTLFQVNQFSLSVSPVGESEIFLEYGDSYEEVGAQPLLFGTLLWQEGVTRDEISLEILSDLQEDKLGKYTVTYIANLEGLQATATRTVWVVDTEAPVITLTESGETLLPGTAYVEEGFTAVDNYDGDITDQVVRLESYGLISYTVLDSAGNPAYVEREVPYYDPVPPEIHLTEGEHLIVPAGTFFKDPGFVALDNVDGDITEQVEVTGEVLWYQPGTYSLEYSVADNFENATTVTRLVEVQSQPLPEISTPNGYVIYLTFDDGPGPYTDRLLEILDKYDVKATFFVVDTGYNGVMKRIVDAGHSIGIHSVTHEYREIYASPEAYFADLYGMQDIIYKNTGVRTYLLRFPGGSSNTISSFNKGIMTTLTQAVQDAGFRYFDWNVDSNDAGGAKKTKTVVANVTDGITHHKISVVLQHDIHDFSVEAVEDIIVWGLNNGYKFLPLEMDSPVFSHGVNN